MDWDDQRRVPAQRPCLPEWTLPEDERCEGADHVLTMLEGLRAGLPSDTNRLREMYRHLKLALSIAGQPEQNEPALVAT